VIPGLSTAKLIGLAIVAAAILSFVLLAFHWKHQAADRGEKLAVICQSTRDASGQPKLKCSDVPAQIKFMGEAIGTLTQAIHKQNDAVTAMGAESERQKAEAAKASQAAQKRSTGAQAMATRLEASSRAGGPPCEPSKALKGAWQ
jgi:hypothetical protein